MYFFYMLLYKPWKGIYTFNKFLAKCGERECLFIKCFCCTVLNWCKSSLKFILWTCSRNGKSCAPWVSLKWKNGKEKKIALSQSCTISLTILKENKICTLTKWPIQEELILVTVAWSNKKCFHPPCMGCWPIAGYSPHSNQHFVRFCLQFTRSHLGSWVGHSEGCVLPKSTTQSCTLPVL